MYIHVVDVNKDRISFFSAFLDLQSIRDDETTISKKLIFFNALTDVPIILITSRITRVEVANSGSFSENIRKLPFSIIRTTDYS